MRKQPDLDGVQVRRVPFLSRTYAAVRAVVVSSVLAAFFFGTTSVVVAQTAPQKSLLTESDFTFLGAFRLPAAGTWDTAWGRGLTHRYVGGELRFFRTAYVSSGSPAYYPVFEVTAPTPSQTEPYPEATLVRQWGNIYRQANGAQPFMPDTMGLYWDALTQRLYYTRTHIYWTDPKPVATLGYATLNESTGVGTAAGEWGLQNLGFKQIAGGFLPIPGWFERAYTPGRRLGVGFGGYFSIASVGPISFGPALTAMPAEFASYPNGSFIPDWTKLVGYPYMDPGLPWWELGLSGPRDSDRAHRDTDYRTEFDKWVPHNGVGYWSWTDAIWQGAVWIDLPTKHGVLFFPNQGNGRLWYGNGGGNQERGSNWWYVYDPQDLARVAQGLTPEWRIQASRTWPARYPGLTYPLTGFAINRIVTGATYDESMGRLYLAVSFAGSNSETVVYVYQVDSAR